MILKLLFLTVTSFSIIYTERGKFVRTIEAVGFPFYRILMSLGTCKDRILWDEQKAWGTVRLNRILDIRYKSYNVDYKVSRVEIKVVINDTDCFAFSEMGVGHQEFTATLFVPTKVAVIMYHLTIFTCNRVLSSLGEKTREGIDYDMPKEMPKNMKEIPIKIGTEEKEAKFPALNIAPDRGPHHLVLDQV